jgi:hypothetical protein
MDRMALGVGFSPSNVISLSSYHPQFLYSLILHPRLVLLAT